MVDAPVSLLTSTGVDGPSRMEGTADSFRTG
jgi:hypothetical protein